MSHAFFLTPLLRDIAVYTIAVMKLWLIVALLFSSADLISQKVDLSFLQRALMSYNTQVAQDHLKTVGFYFSEAANKGEGDSCVEDYIYRRGVTDVLSFPFTEIVLLRRNCEHDIWFNLVRFMTRDRENFDFIKQQCILNPKNRFVKDGVEGDELVQRYSGENWTYFFRTGRDSGADAFILDIVYSYPRVKIPLKSSNY